MKKRIIIISSLIFAIVLIPIVLVCFAFGISPQYNKSFYGGMAIKYNRIKSVKTKKVVIIGGSSVAFGVRSDIMEKELGRPVVNFGLYANLGTKYMLDVAEDYINKGDIVIIAPEQNKQALSLYFNGEAVWYSVDGCYGILSDIAGDNFGDMAKAFFKFTSGKFAYSVNGNKPDPDGVYNAKSFNSYGDIKYDRPYNTMKNGYDSSTPISFSKQVIDREFIKYINDYGKRLNKKGASVYYSYCPMNEKASPSTDTEIKSYYDYLNNKLDFTVIGNPRTHLLDSDWFYDSNFHLNNAGAVYYSTLLAQELKAELGDYSPITTPVPDKPEVPEDISSEGTVSEDLAEAAKIFKLNGVEISTDNDKVVFRGRWCVDGLTERGKTLGEITIPDTLCGVPVTDIADGCFKNNTKVAKITLGKNIETIGIDAFAGCSSLKSVYVTSTDPNSCHVASSVLDGLTDCSFYVPEKAYNDYVFDYFWSFIHTTNPLKKY